jgi:predicted Zn-dependent protease
MRAGCERKAGCASQRPHINRAEPGNRKERIYKESRVKEVSQSRIEAFEAMIKDQPEDTMVWYGLASEYFKLERWSDAAEALRNVVRLNPNYTAAYQMLGTALMNQGEPDQARLAWTEGVEVATRTGAWKARQHMEGLLADASVKTASEFCAE